MIYPIRQRHSSEHSCELCAGRRRPTPPMQMLPEEFEAVQEHSGSTGERRDGVLIVNAVLVRRRQWLDVPGSKCFVMADVDWPVIACPWSPRPVGQRRLLHHGPAWHSAMGGSCSGASDADGRSALDHRASHCPAAPVGGYYLRYLEAPELPRRQLDQSTGRIGSIVAGKLLPPNAR
jgi:hypothetical protein